MDIEQLAIRDFMAQSAPLDALDDRALDALIGEVQIRYLPAGDQLMQIGGVNREAVLIRSGAVEVSREDNSLYGRFGEGDWVGHRTVLRGDGKVIRNVAVIEDALFYCLPEAAFRELLARHDEVARWFNERKHERVRRGIEQAHNPGRYRLMTTRLVDIARRPLCIGPRASIRELARAMTADDEHAALVVDNGQLIGIVTDADFRAQVVAAGRDPDAPVHSIMTPQPYRLPPRAPASEALLLMAGRNVRHVPVVDPDSGAPLGIVGSADLLRSQSNNPIYLVGDIHKAPDVQTLVQLSEALPGALVSMVQANLPAYDIGHAISSVGQAITRRLIALAEEELGPPPVPYAFICAGSMARREQTARSDQDHGIILDDRFVPAEHDGWFAALAKRVSDGMDACGYEYCPGHVMATNPEWRQPLSVWRQIFHRWIDTPKPQALLNASIWFDLRWLHGERQLMVALHEDILARTRQASLFKAHLAATAQAHKPPLGIFRGFVLDPDGKGDKALNLKLRGVVPVTDVARVRALANGLPALNTVERLDAVAETHTGLTRDDADVLKDALAFIGATRLHHQAQQIDAGEAADNFVDPDSLSALERRTLKDAFAVVANAQDALARAHGGALF